MVVRKLDDENYPVLTMGQAAELLGVRPAFLRSLDAAQVLQPQRSRGGHRRYSRRQLVLATRMRTLFDEGFPLEAAHRIVRLEDQLDDARQRIAVLEAGPDAQRGTDPGPSAWPRPADLARPAAAGTADYGRASGRVQRLSTDPEVPGG